MKANNIKFVAILFILCCACENKDKTLLSSAWSIVETNPGRVISMLDTCSFRGPSQRAQRAWLLSRAYDKCDIIITSDSLINQAVNYYRHSHNQTMYLRSLYCKGRIQLNAGDSFLALETFEKVADMARKRKDWFWLGLSARNMADIFTEAYCTDKALQCEKEAVFAFSQSGDSLYLSYEQLALARCYHNNRQTSKCDSILAHMFSQTYTDSVLLAEIHKTQARTLIERRRPLYKEAYQHYMMTDNAIMEIHDWCNLLPILATMGEGYDNYTLSLHKQLSDLATRSDDITSAFVNSSEYLYYKILGDYKSSLSSLERLIQYQDSLTQRNIQQSLVLQQKDYYKRLSIEEQRKRMTVLAYSIIGAILALIGLSMLMQRNKLQRGHIETALAQLEETQSMYDRLAKDSFQQQIDMLSQLAEEYYYSADRAQQNAFYLHFKKKLEAFRTFNAKLDFLEKDINIFKNQAMSLFREEFPSLSLHGYKMATVFFAGLPNPLIGLLMNKSTPTIRTERSQLRKTIFESNAPHKEMFLTLIDDYQRGVAGRRKKEE